MVTPQEGNLFNEGIKFQIHPSYVFQPRQLLLRGSLAYQVFTHSSHTLHTPTEPSSTHKYMYMYHRQPDGVTTYFTFHGLTQVKFCSLLFAFPQALLSCCLWSPHYCSCILLFSVRVRLIASGWFWNHQGVLQNSDFDYFCFPLSILVFSVRIWPFLP